eukprot:11404427-Alexandrium_andersonii.AAC.1
MHSKSRDGLRQTDAPKESRAATTSTPFDRPRETEKQTARQATGELVEATAAAGVPKQHGQIPGAQARRAGRLVLSYRVLPTALTQTLEPKNQIHNATVCGGRPL